MGPRSDAPSFGSPQLQESSATCAAHALLRSDGLPATQLLAPGLMNGAIAAVGGLLVIAANKDQKVQRSPLANCSCRSYHHVLLGNVPCSATPRALSDATVHSPLFSGELPFTLPHRPCQDLRNYRGNGPEDTRILPVGAHEVLFFTTDYFDLPGHKPAYGRYPVLYRARVQHYGNVSGLRLRVDGPLFTLGTIEKNWSPFEAADGGVWLHQWIDHPRKGTSIALRVRPHDGGLVERHEAPSGRLREAVGVLDSTSLSPGTSAVRLNATHRLAVGHTRTLDRRYAMFAYLFAATPPFALTAATPQFVLHWPPASTDAKAAGGWSWAPRDLRSKDFHPLRGAQGAERLWHEEQGRIQFPIGLARASLAEAGGDALLLSWGHNDGSTMLSAVRLHALLARLTPFAPHEGEAAESFTRHAHQNASARGASVPGKLER